MLQQFSDLCQPRRLQRSNLVAEDLQMMRTYSGVSLCDASSVQNFHGGKGGMKGKPIDTLDFVIQGGW